MTDHMEGGGASKTTDPAAGSSAATDVSLREFIAMQFRWMLALFVVIWFFVERHLSDLNHENERLAKYQEGSVSADTYKANEDQRRTEAANLNEWRKEVDGDRSRSISREEFEGKSHARSRSNLGLSTQAASLVLLFATVVIALLTYIAVHH